MGTERMNELFFKACEDGELNDVQVGGAFHPRAVNLNSHNRADVAYGPSQRLLHAGAHLNARIGG